MKLPAVTYTPLHWGGYRMAAETAEFLVGRENQINKFGSGSAISSPDPA